MTNRFDFWVPACGGAERPFKTRTGKTLLYCWNQLTGEHAYLDCETDIILSQAEAEVALAMFAENEMERDWEEKQSAAAASMQPLFDTLSEGRY